MRDRAYYNEFDPFAAAWLRELIRDGLGRVSHGEQRYNAKLDPRKIADARARVEAGESIRSVAIHLGVAHRTLSNAIKGRTWSRLVSQPSGSLT